MILNVNQLLQSKDLLLSWTIRTIRVRYQQSLLGLLWAVVQPILTILIFTVIFTRFIPVDTGGLPYAAFAFIALVPWTLFATSLTDMTNSIVINMDLVNKIYFPREILPLAALFARLFDFLISYTFIILLLLYYQLPFLSANLAFFPAILAIQLALMIGLGFMSAASNVFFRDVSHLLGFGIQLWFYLTPIVYPVSTVPAPWRLVYFLNPMAGVIEAYRDVLLYQRAPGPYLLLSGSIALIILLAGYWFFKRVEYEFADII